MENALGDTDADFGKELLGIVAGFAQQLGSLMIAVGIAQLQFELGLATLNPVVAIAAGVALVVAAGALLASTTKKGPSGKGSSSSSSSPSGSSSGSPALQSIQGQGFGTGSLVAKIDGQDLRFVMQAANDNYNGLN